MKKAIITVLILTVLGGLGVASYKLVQWGKGVSISVVSKGVEEGSKEVTSKEDKEIKDTTDVFYEENSTSSSDVIGNSSVDYENSLNFSSAKEFIKSYNKLINNLGEDIKEESFYVESARSTLVSSEVGNLSVISYNDGSIYQVVISGESIKTELEGFMNGIEADINEGRGNTIISNIRYNR